MRLPCSVGVKITVQCIRCVTGGVAFCDDFPPLSTFVEVVIDVCPGCRVI